MKNIVYLFSLLFLVSCTSEKECTNTTRLTDLVNPLMGTDSERDLSNGNTYPAIARPWGMNFWTPQTGKMGDGFCYTYDAHKIRGIKQTHQPSPWINDYAAFSFMPVVGELKFKEDERASWFSHKAEIAKPHYYSVYLADYGVTAEVTPTDRAAQFQFTFPQHENSWIVLDGFDGGSMVKIIPEERKIIGYCQNNHGGVPDNFRNYFVAVFDKDFSDTKVWEDSVLKELNEAEGFHVGAVVGFKTKNGEKINVKVASSFISLEQAGLNLEREVGNKTFAETKKEGQLVWEKEFSRIKVEGGTEEQQKTFYSCLYRTLLFPRKFYEFDKNNNVVHYSPYNGEVLPGYMFTDNGFWDTFRAVFPFFTLMYPELNSQIMQGLVNTYKESGWLPEWASPGHRNCMIGSNSASLIADSYLKGIRGYDIELLYEAIIKNTKENHKTIRSVGRFGAEQYNKLGYLPFDEKIGQTSSRTLEYAYADFCISKLAQELGKPQDEIDLFRERARNYKNVFDPEVNLMRGRYEDGSFQAPFNQYRWSYAFTEGSTWHYSWSVFQDIEGLKNLMGGDQQFVEMLDSVFVAPPIYNYDWFYGGTVIHEIREMQVAGMGNYAHGNQPVQHMIYLYNYTSEPWKTQCRVRQVMDKLYTPYPDGYCGDEDNGQTSAWYVFSAIGFYPVCPGTDQYVLGSPLFQKITLQLENGNEFIVELDNYGQENFYIDRVRLNGSSYDKNYLRHSTIQDGGKLELKMSDSPNKKRGISLQSYPYSMTGEE
uniref:GH92 family glycosyl hydrolase n=1 Tax=uncultured Draconibacterium sp. TaxID=1573823 RepID=UPI0032175156